MDSTYSSALKAGTVGGILLILLSLINFIYNITSSQRTLAFEEILGVLCLLIIAAISIITGILSVHLAKPYLKDTQSAYKISRISGLLAGIIYGVIQIILAVIMDFIGYIPPVDLTSLGIMENSYTTAQILFGVAICFPFWVVIIVFFANTGGIIYTDILSKRYLK